MEYSSSSQAFVVKAVAAEILWDLNCCQSETKEGPFMTLIQNNVDLELNKCMDQNQNQMDFEINKSVHTSSSSTWRHKIH